MSSSPAGFQQFQQTVPTEVTSNAMSQILIVEDEDIIRTALRRLLERNGYKVHEATSVQEAIEKHDLDAMDAIISDLRLPGVPGTDLIKRTHTPVLIMTSYASLRSAIDS